ncbi:MAG: hypothetical protein AUK31_01420 [Fibrobacteres bacterium CG2_30_45_31]|nr:MAG: hypothetical protein AUK31_01420 [Fibrobacteres bacterium CG2_30_45_31]
MTKSKIVGTLLLLTSFSLAAVQDDIRAAELQKATLNVEIKKLDRQLRESDSLLKDDVKRYALLESRYTEDLNRRHAEIDSLNEKIKRVAVELQAERNKQATYKGRIENDKSKRKAMRLMLTRICVDLESQVMQTLPWDKATRLDRVRALRRDLESNNALEEEAFSRINSIIGEEVRFGDEVQLINTPMTRKNGESINARLLRIGNQWMVYSDENSTMFGILVREGTKDSVTFEWKETLTLEEREAIKTALDVKQARKPPQMVTLPLSISIYAQEGK